MLLDLNKLHGQREHVERTLQPAALGRTILTTGSCLRSSCRWTSRRWARMSSKRAAGCKPGSNSPAAAWSRPKSRWTRRSSCARAAPRRRRLGLDYRRGTRNRGRRPDDGVLQGRPAGHRDLLREQFQLALPMKPLCSDGAALCPQCGVNRNRTDCGCSAAWEDPRLAPLKSLLNRPKEN